jgi:hypothetical protein
MRLSKLIVTCAALVLPMTPAIGQSADQVANDPVPQVNGARARLVDDSGIDGGKALRVTVSKLGKNVWDSAVESSLNKPVKAGDRLVLYFDARLEKGADNAASAPIPYIAIQMKSAPYASVIQGSATLTPKWEMHKIEGKADKDYAADALKATVHVGNARQTIDMGPVVVLNLGQ